MAATSPLQLPAAARPNIVVIIADDLDTGSLDALLQAGLMPNLQSHIADRGITFRQCFGTTPVCTPSRATFLTGRYAHNHHAARNESPFGGITAFDDGATLATWLRAAGFRTGHVGKYLNGYGTADINHDGATNLRDLTYIPPGWNYWFGLLDPYANRMYQYAANDNGRIVAFGTAAADYQTDVLAGKAATILQNFKRDGPTDPFFLTIATGAPHPEVYPDLAYSQYSDAWKWSIRPAPRHLGTVPLALPRPPSFNEPDMSDKPAWMQLRPLLASDDVANLTAQYQNRLASMRAVDDLIGTLYAKLAILNQLDRTIIIFTSDNGYLYGEHRLPQKLVAHEESIRIPLMVSAPWLRKAEAQQMVVNNDLAPTIAELAGATPGFVPDGTSLVALLADPARTNWRKRFLIERWPGAPSIFELPSYFAVRTAPDTPYTPNEVLIQYSDGSREFYDLNIDPFEIASLHADPSVGRVQQRYVLSSWMNQLASCAGTACRDSEFFSQGQ